MEKQIYYIKGMHCASCEILIEKKMLEIGGVEFVDASLAGGKIEIGYNKENPSVDLLNKIFKENGYVFSEKPFAGAKGWKNNIGPAIIAVFAIGLFFLFSRIGLSSFADIGSKSSLAAFFVFGLLAGVSSCAALVGGLVLSLSKQWTESYGKSGSFLDKAKPHFLFNLGRLISYSLLGVLLGFAGEKFKISPLITSILVLAVSLAMLVLALQMLGVRWFGRFRLALPKRFSSQAFKNGQSGGRSAPFVIGFLTFLLPCGFTVAAEGIAILSADALRGSLIMFSFALGTMIPLLAIGLSSAKLASNPKLSQGFLKAAGILIIFFVFYNINFQFGLIGYSASSQQANGGGDQNARRSNTSPDVQAIKTVYTQGSDIVPSDFIVKKGQPVRFEVDVQDNGLGCMGTIMIPGLWDKPQQLKKGELIIMEFTPQKTGTYQITCAMGVPRGTIKVIE
ncbi:MAG: sulfite exporter TauE/SafE family protein [Candidatus Paceibacterota bacterium]|jgi:sulfite exporter TauE/SafE/copper chaperone CopZ